MTSLPPGRGQAQVQWTPMPPRLVESAAAGMPLWGDAGSRRWVPGRACRASAGRLSGRAASGNARALAYAASRCSGARLRILTPVAGVSASPASTTRIRAALRSAIRRAKAAPTGPLPIISTSMFSSISVHAFVVLRAHARCRCTENRYYSFVRPDKWFLMIAAIAGRDRSWLTRRGKH